MYRVVEIQGKKLRNIIIFEIFEIIKYINNNKIGCIGIKSDTQIARTEKSLEIILPI